MRLHIVKVLLDMGNDVTDDGACHLPPDPATPQSVMVLLKKDYAGSQSAGRKGFQ